MFATGYWMASCGVPLNSGTGTVTLSLRLPVAPFPAEQSFFPGLRDRLALPGVRRGRLRDRTLQISLVRFAVARRQFNGLSATSTSTIWHKSLRFHVNWQVSVCECSVLATAVLCRHPI